VVDKNKKLDEEMKEQFGGSRLSKFLFFVSWIFLICLVLSFFWRIAEYDPQGKTIVSSRWVWESTVACAVAWLCTSYLAYRLAGGRRNPIICKDKSQQEEITPQKVPSYLFWAILATFCFIPFGIVAIVYASQVRAFLRSKDYSRAIDASRKSKKWCWFSLMAGLFIAVLLYYSKA